MALTVNTNNAEAAPTQAAEAPKVALARVGTAEDGTPQWVLAKAGNKEFVHCSKELSRDLDAQYALGRRRSNFNVSELEPKHKLWFVSQGVKDGWMNRNASSDHVGFAFNPTPEVDTKSLTPDQVLATFALPPRQPRGLPFAGRTSRFARP